MHSITNSILFSKVLSWIRQHLPTVYTEEKFAVGHKIVQNLKLFKIESDDQKCRRAGLGCAQAQTRLFYLFSKSLSPSPILQNKLPGPSTKCKSQAQNNPAVLSPNPALDKYNFCVNKADYGCLYHRFLWPLPVVILRFKEPWSSDDEGRRHGGQNVVKEPGKVVEICPEASF
jgi:hypothetical protein